MVYRLSRFNLKIAYKQVNIFYHMEWVRTCFPNHELDSPAKHHVICYSTLVKDKEISLYNSHTPDRPETLDIDYHIVYFLSSPQI